METKSYDNLRKILKIHKEGETGKILQCLLGLSFSRMSYKPEKIEVNLVEGVDIVLEDEQYGKYAIEVKTTSRDKIRIEDIDLKKLESYEKNGYTAMVSILKISLYSKWLFIPLEKFKRKHTWNVDDLSTFNDNELSNKVNETFENLLSKYSDDIKKGGLRFMLDLLEKESIKFSRVI